MNLRFHPLFKEDLEESADYLQREGLGDELREEVAQIVLKVAKTPELFDKTYTGVRRARLRRFKLYAVHYMLRDDDTFYYLSVQHGVGYPETGSTGAESDSSESRRTTPETSRQYP